MCPGSYNINGTHNPHWVNEGEEHSKQYFALHIFIRHRLPKPSHCPICKQQKSKLDLSNISGTYKSDLSDWEYLCHRCHMIKDGIIPHPTNPKIIQYGKGFTPEIRKHMSEKAKGRKVWNKGKTMSDEMKKRISDTKKRQLREQKAFIAECVEGDPD